MRMSLWLNALPITKYLVSPDKISLLKSAGSGPYPDQTVDLRLDPSTTHP